MLSLVDGSFITVFMRIKMGSPKHQPNKTGPRKSRQMAVRASASFFLAFSSTCGGILITLLEPAEKELEKAKIGSSGSSDTVIQVKRGKKTQSCFLCFELCQRRRFFALILALYPKRKVCYESKNHVFSPALLLPFFAYF